MLGFGAYLIIKGELSLGGLIGFQLLASQFSGPINGLISFGGELQQIAVELKRIDDVLDYPVDYKHAPNSSGNKQIKIKKEESKTAKSTVSSNINSKSSYKLSGKIEFKNVTFGYSRLKPPLIHDFNLTMNPGDRVALVGTSGSGKSTVAKLISGLFLPWEGSVLLDGMPINEIKPELLANSLSMVDQTPFFFKGSVKGNLTLWNDSISSELLKKVTLDGGIYDDIVSRKDAFDGEIYEGGGNFSGGQLQRMEIARSLINNPSILILDEATSALDPIYEKYIYERVWSYGCSIVVIAHRLSAVRDCNEIIVLDKGNIVERGNHELLISKQGYYYELIKSE
jgi:ATP-binding cassette, subfamily C, bacterial